MDNANDFRGVEQLADVFVLFFRQILDLQGMASTPNEDLLKVSLDQLSQNLAGEDRTVYWLVVLISEPTAHIPRHMSSGVVCISYGGRILPCLTL